MNNSSLPKFDYGGARSLIMLHEKHIISFFNTWQKARELNIPLPKTEDADYDSLETVLRHVLRSL